MPANILQYNERMASVVSTMAAGGKKISFHDVKCARLSAGLMSCFCQSASDPAGLRHQLQSDGLASLRGQRPADLG